MKSRVASGGITTGARREGGASLVALGEGEGGDEGREVEVGEVVALGEGAGRDELTCREVELGDVGVLGEGESVAAG